ncbi:Fe2+ transport system protein A [Thermanaerovibrio velox DSM 12556]|uniref:Fe2+ transport system protein A n=1 Tax=Thermanaerovibrio velox DSM 12556 TaxID=926567 RepID=H0UR40_9BACT|nr:FeoA family protein [Thermanaerovibrio velox]EHM10877.1 Fe2+ transport system protein A [Thermanaerovibrio velox DSM 12556]
MCPLSSASEGEVLSVLRVRLEPQEVKKLGEMGISPGMRLRLVRRDRFSVVVDAAGSRLALGGQVASRIWVAPVPGA